MKSENRQKTLAAFKDLWQGNLIRRTRSVDGHASFYGRWLAVHLMVQSTVARGFMAKPLAAEPGFLPRFLNCEPTSAIGTRMQANTRRDDMALTSFSDNTAKQIQWWQGTAWPHHQEGGSIYPKTADRRHDVACADGEEQPEEADTWTAKLLDERPFRLATVAMANKSAWIIWAPLTKREEYRQPIA